MAVAKKKDKNKKKKHKPATKLILLEGGAAVAKRRQAAVEAAAAVAPSSTKGRNDGKLTLTGVRSKDTWAHVNERRIIFFRMGEDDVDVEFLAVVTDVENQKTTVRKNCEETTISKVIVKYVDATKGDISALHFMENGPAGRIPDGRSATQTTFTDKKTFEENSKGGDRVFASLFNKQRDENSVAGGQNAFRRKMQVKRNKKKKKTGNTCVGAKAAEFLDAADPGIKFHNVDVDVADKDDVVELPLDQPTRELALAMEKFAPGRKIDGAGFDYYSDGPDPLHGRDIVMLWDEPRGWFLGHVSRREKMGALFPGRTRLKTTNGHMTWRIVFAEDARWSEYDLEDRTEAMDLLPGKRGPGDAMSACGQWVLLEKKKKKQKKKKTEEEKQKQEDTLRPMRTVIEDDNLFRWLKLHVEKKGLAHVLGAVHLVAMDVDQESKKKKRA